MFNTKVKTVKTLLLNFKASSWLSAPTRLQKHTSSYEPLPARDRVDPSLTLTLTLTQRGTEWTCLDPDPDIAGDREDVPDLDPDPDPAGDREDPPLTLALTLTQRGTEWAYLDPDPDPAGDREDPSLTRPSALPPGCLLSSHDH